MRVIAGTARRLTLVTPRGMNTRPTTDQIKETLFNMIQNDLECVRFLDLFAGSGGIGIEALSRGAGECVFVDSDKDALRCINANLDHTKLRQRAEVIGYDYRKALRRLRNGRRFDIIFMDPPYSKGIERDALRMVAEYDLLSDGGIVIIETTKDDVFDDLPEGYMIRREKVYKSNKHLFIGKETDQ